MKRSIFPLLKPIATPTRWPDSTKQSLENPLQEDRLPRGAKLELEYAAKQYTLKSNRLFTLKQFAIAAGFSALFFFYEHYFNFIYVWTHCYLALAALTAFLYAASKKPGGAWIWTLMLFGIPFLTLVFFSYRNGTFPLLLAAVCSLYLADQFTKHVLYLNTTVPVPAQVARNYRVLWKYRFLPLFHKPNGVEFYLLGFLVVAYGFANWYFQAPGDPPGTFLAYLPSFLTLLALLLVPPLVIEPVAAFLTKRRYIGPVRTLRHFLAALLSWFTYNRRMADYPGTFRSPAGPSWGRCWMGIASTLIFTAAVIPFFSRHRDRLITAWPEPYYDFRTGVAHFPDPPPDESLWPWQRATKRLHRKEEILKGEKDPFPELDQSEEVTDEDIARGLASLEPYQRALLKRMTQEEAEAYVKELVERKEAKLPKRRPNIWERLVFITEREELNSPKFRMAYYTLQAAAWGPATTYFILCLALPPALMLACLFCVSARAVAYSGERFSAGLPTHDAHDAAAGAAISRVRSSQLARERNSLFLGVNAYDGTPVIVPRDVFKEHAHLLGDSGSGKTSLGMTSLISQLIEFGDSSLVVIDLKADDLALFEGTREKAAEVDKKLKEEHPDKPEAGYPFRWFTNELHRSTFAFNILTQSCFKTLTSYQRADMLTVAMGLQYGTDYGRAYYSTANIELLHQTLSQNPDLKSFSELAQLLRQSSRIHMHHELKRAASHLHAVVNRLADCEPINVASPDRYSPEVLDSAIDLVQVFTKPQVLYFHLPSLIGTTSSAEIARFVVHMLLASSKSVGPKRNQVYLFIDEFQRITAGNLEIILQTARSMNVGVILANQTMSDLKTSGVDLISTVEANTRFRQIFAASDLAALRQVVESSGETIIHNQSWTQYLGSMGVVGGAFSRASTETISPRLRPNDVILASDHPLQSIVYVRRGKDYAQYGGFPFVMTSSYLTSHELYTERKNAKWPAPVPGTISPAPPQPKSSEGVPTPEIKEPREDPILPEPKNIPDATPEDAQGALEPTDSAAPEPLPLLDDPLREEWQEVKERRKRQKRRRTRPQDKYRNPDSSSHEPNEDPPS